MAAVYSASEAILAACSKKSVPSSLLLPSRYGTFAIALESNATRGCSGKNPFGPSTTTPNLQGVVVGAPLLGFGCAAFSMISSIDLPRRHDSWFEVLSQPSAFANSAMPAAAPAGVASTPPENET